MKLVIVACCKNEGAYIKEWIEYHSMLGVEQFYIYDAGTDNTREVVSKYGHVTYIPWTCYPAQLEAYRDFISFKRDVWAAFIDLDEYIVPKTGNLKGFLRDFERVDIAGLAIGWTIFGSSGHVQRPKGLIIESYTKTVDYTKNKERFTKCIVRPNKISEINDPHFFIPKGNARIVREDFYQMSFGDHHHRTLDDFPVSKIQLNHYFCKSFEDFQTKVARRGPDGGGRLASDFENCNQTANAVTDLSIQQYLPELKRRMYGT